MPVLDPEFREETPLDLSQGIVGPESPSHRRVSFAPVEASPPGSLFPLAPYGLLDHRQIGYLTSKAREAIQVKFFSQEGKKLPASELSEIDIDLKTGDLIARDSSGAVMNHQFVDRRTGNPVKFPTPPVQRGQYRGASKTTPRNDPKLDKILRRIAKLEGMKKK
jgi:hypothetical protein